MTSESLHALVAALEGAAQLARAAADQTYDPAQLLTYVEAGELLKVHRNTIGKLVQAGALPCVRIGKGKHAVRVRRADLAAYVERQRKLPRRIRQAARGVA